MRSMIGVGILAFSVIALDAGCGASDDNNCAGTLSCPGDTDADNSVTDAAVTTDANQTIDAHQTTIDAGQTVDATPVDGAGTNACSPFAQPDPGGQTWSCTGTFSRECRDPKFSVDIISGECFAMCLDNNDQYNDTVGQLVSSNQTAIIHSFVTSQGGGQLTCWPL